MKTQIQSIHFDADVKLEELILGKLDKLSKTYNRIESCNVILRTDKNNKNKNKVAEISLSIPGNRLFASDQSETFEIAADLAIEEIKRQLMRHKDKLLARNHLGPDITMVY